MLQDPKYSIVIPTLNEEKYLPLLLKDIYNQTLNDYEVIVADACSKDKTRKYAKKFKAKVVEGGLPAKARNNGAKYAKGQFLIFLDADVRIPKTFFKKIDKEIYNHYLDLATCRFKPISKKKIDKIMHDIVNYGIILSQYIDPHAPGFCIIVSKRLFNRVHGFNEKLKLAEDHDFVKRASKFRKLKVIESTYFKVSVRRLDKEGRLGLAEKYAFVEIYRLLFGDIYKDLFNYEFGNYDNKNNKKSKKLIKKIKQKYNRMITEINSKEKILNITKKTLFRLNKEFKKIDDKLDSILHN